MQTKVTSLLFRISYTDTTSKSPQSSIFSDDEWLDSQADVDNVSTFPATKSSAKKTPRVAKRGKNLWIMIFLVRSFDIPLRNITNYTILYFLLGTSSTSQSQLYHKVVPSFTLTQSIPDNEDLDPPTGSMWDESNDGMDDYDMDQASLGKKRKSFFNTSKEKTGLIKKICIPNQNGDFGKGKKASQSKVAKPKNVQAKTKKSAASALVRNEQGQGNSEDSRQEDIVDGRKWSSDDTEALLDIIEDMQADFDVPCARKSVLWKKVNCVFEMGNILFN